MPEMIIKSIGCEEQNANHFGEIHTHKKRRENQIKKDSRFGLPQLFIIHVVHIIGSLSKTFFSCVDIFFAIYCYGFV